MNLVHVDELDAIEMPEGFTWRPVRKHFGIKAFGTNAYTPGASGQIVEQHTEERFEHEEIYLVLRGRVQFTIDGYEHELGPGQLVFVKDPSLERGAVALTDDAAVLAVGGKPGHAHEVSSWEYVFIASPYVQSGRWDEAKRLMQEGLEQSPATPRSSTTSRASKRARASPTQHSIFSLPPWTPTSATARTRRRTRTSSRSATTLASRASRSPDRAARARSNLVTDCYQVRGRPALPHGRAGPEELCESK